MAADRPICRSGGGSSPGECWLARQVEQRSLPASGIGSRGHLGQWWSVPSAFVRPGRQKDRACSLPLEDCIDRPGSIRALPFPFPLGGFFRYSGKSIPRRFTTKNSLSSVGHLTCVGIDHCPVRAPSQNKFLVRGCRHSLLVLLIRWPVSHSHLIPPDLKGDQQTEKNF